MQQLQTRPLPAQDLSVRLTHANPASGQPSGQPSNQRWQVIPDTHVNPIPQQRTPLVGRERELAEIAAQLREPACRLLTLTGPGGIGKTRLAMQTATEHREQFRDGVFFVSLQAVRAHQFVPVAIVDAIQPGVGDQSDPLAYLFNLLRDRQVLLVLDNFEQLLSVPDTQMTGEGVALLAQLLAISPHLKIVVTSREVLNLQEEWIYPLVGLRFPRSAQVERAESYEAVQLFTERARRVRFDFSLAGELEGLIRICQLVEGMPLALELAAAWTKTLPCHEIANQIERDLDFLTTRLHDLPPRHRNMYAAFEQSWRLLQPDEQSVFRRMAIFRGGFDHQAAAMVCGASLVTVAMLVDKSLLRIERESAENARYQIHELLRQFAERQLAATADELAETQRDHARFYANFLDERMPGLLCDHQVQTMLEIKAELNNLRTAWAWSVEEGNVEILLKAAIPLATFYHIQGHFHEGIEALRLAIERVLKLPPSEACDRLTLLLWTGIGWLQLRTSRMLEAKNSFERALVFYERLEMPRLLGIGTDPRLGLSMITHIMGDYPTAERVASQALATALEQNHPWNQFVAENVLTHINIEQGYLPQALEHAQRSYAITLACHDQWSQTYCLNALGQITMALGDFASARGHLEASFVIRKQFNDPEGMMLALILLGEVVRRQQVYDEALYFYEQAIPIAETIGARIGIVQATTGAALTTIALADFKGAWQYLRQALVLGSELKLLTFLPMVLNAVGCLLWKVGQTERAVEVLALTTSSPLSKFSEREQVQQMLEQIRSEVAYEGFASAFERGQQFEIESLASELIAELDVLPLGGDVAESPPPRTKRIVLANPSVVYQPVSLSEHTLTEIETLTRRETEVLHLLASGRSNREIADQLIVTVGTVKSYTAQIYEKLGVNNRTQAVVRANELAMLN